MGQGVPKRPVVLSPEKQWDTTGRLMPGTAWAFHRDASGEGFAVGGASEGSSEDRAAWLPIVTAWVTGLVMEMDRS